MMKHIWKSNWIQMINKTPELFNMIIVVRSVFHEDSNYYPQIFLDECLLDRTECERTELSKRIDVDKTDGLPECIIFHYWYFLNIHFKFWLELCNACHDLMQKVINFDDVAIITVKENNYKTST